MMDIERLATSAVIGRLSYCRGLSPFINDGDKEPSFDGNIYVYPNDNELKSELIARVPVQVKGKKKTVKSATSSFSFDAEISDLTNYRNDGGIIFFTVAICDDRSKSIFYKCLLPFDLERILRDVSKQKTKSIHLRKLPDDDKAIKQIFLSFIADKKRQATQIVWTSEQAVAAAKDGASLSFHIQPKDKINNIFDIMREATTQSHYLYIKTKVGVEFPFAKIDENNDVIINTRIDAPVIIGDKTYYDHFYIGCENGIPHIYIGQALKLPFVDEENSDKQLTFNYVFSGTLSQRIADTNCIIAITKNKQLFIENNLVLETKFSNPEEVLWLEKLNDNLKRIKSALDYFGVKTDLVMDALDEEDYRNLNSIILASEDTIITFTEGNLPHAFFTNVKVGNLLIRAQANKCEGSEGYKLQSAFTDLALARLELSDQDGNTTIIEPYSAFLLMCADDFVCSNINFEIILNSIKAMRAEDLEIETNLSGDRIISANNMLLEIIKAFDNTENSVLLDFALDVAKILLSKHPSTIINKMQVIKRKRSLSNDEIGTLVDLRNKKKQHNAIKCAVSILLGESEEAISLLGVLSENDRKQIVDYPIYSLLK